MSTSYNTTRRACYIGYIIQGIIVNLSPILFIVFRTSFGLSYEKLGGLIMINFTIQLLVDMLSMRFIDRIGYRVPIVAAQGFATLGLVMLGVLPIWFSNAYSGLVIATVFMAIGGGLLEVLVSPIIDSLPAPEQNKAANMSLLHSFYCWGQVAVVLLTTLCLRVIGMDKWFVLPFIWALVPFVNTFAFVRAPLVPPVAIRDRISLRVLLQKPAFLLILLLMLCAGASELTISQWSSLFAEQGLGLAKLWGDLAGPCMFAILMGIGRVFYGIVGAKIRLLPFMLFSAVLCLACYFAIALTQNPVISLIACAISGFSVSVMWPGTLSAASRHFPLGGTAMFAILAMFGDMGCSIGPWMAGAIADQSSSLKSGLLFGAIFPLLTIVALTVLFLTGRKTKPFAAKNE